MATPIGNLGDVTPRALETLQSVDLIACEDTRVSGPFLRRFGIATPLISYHEHNAAERLPTLLEVLEQGRTLALIADAGTPLISDPGYRLVRAAQDAGHRVVSVPGPSAAIAAMSIAGLPSDRFLFAGFLPPKSAARRQALDALKPIGATLVFYETGPRLAAMLHDAHELLGAREAAIARELTKRHEELRRSTLDALAAAYAKAPPPKGEIVVLIGPPQAAVGLSDAALDDALRARLREVSPSVAAAELAQASGRPRKEVYRRALALKAEPDADAD
ncbi:MAG: 16S rRNA (cytidine(1402)-2'-O)-methyltransferase [Geminicoccaceae bacterium]